MDIKVDDLQSDLIIKFLQEHHEDMLLHSPAESVHVLDLSSLRAKNVTFWSAWSDGELAGCGALKELDNSHGEIKTMRTSAKFLRKGVAGSILDFILKEANIRSYSRLSLETGTKDVFKPAHNLYKNFGFEFCEPFADYLEDPYSTFMTLKII